MEVRSRLSAGPNRSSASEEEIPNRDMRLRIIAKGVPRSDPLTFAALMREIPECHACSSYIEKEEGRRKGWGRRWRSQKIENRSKKQEERSKKKEVYAPKPLLV